MFPLLVKGCFANDELVNVYLFHTVFYLSVIIFLLYLSAAISSRVYQKVKPVLIIGNQRVISIVLGLFVSLFLGFVTFMVIATSGNGYTGRAQVSEGMYFAKDLIEKIAEYYMAHNKKPEKSEVLSWLDERYSGRKYVSSINIDDDLKIIITYKSEGVATPIQNKTLIFSSDMTDGWNCNAGTLPMECRPGICK